MKTLILPHKSRDNVHILKLHVFKSLSRWNRKLLGLYHQYRVSSAVSILLAFLNLISLKMKTNSSRNGRWIIPFKKISGLTVRDEIKEKIIIKKCLIWYNIHFCQTIAVIICRSSEGKGINLCCSNMPYWSRNIVSKVRAYLQWRR